MGTLFDIFDGAFVGYFMALNLAYTVLLLLGSRQVSEWVRRRPLRDFRGVSALAAVAARPDRRCRPTTRRPGSWSRSTRLLALAASTR